MSVRAQLLVDVGPVGQSLQSGYTGFDITSNSLSGSSQSKSFTADLGAGSQTFTVSLGVGTAIGNNSNAVGGYENNSTATGGTYNALLGDGFFARRDLTFTITGLAAGTYTLVTDNHPGNLSNSAGTITWDLTDFNGSRSGSFTQSGTTTGDTGFENASFGYVIGPSSSLSITFHAANHTGVAPDNVYLNGFEITQVPEPSVGAAFAGCTVLAVALRRRHLRAMRRNRVMVGAAG
jgi:hypothetical protein